MDEGKPVEVFVAFQILDIGEINQEKMDYRLHTFIITIWNDTRLNLEKFRGRPDLIYPECRHYIWTPDIFFETAKKIDMFEDTSPSTFIKVLDDGALCMSTRNTLSMLWSIRDISTRAGCAVNGVMNKEEEHIVYCLRVASEVTEEVVTRWRFLFFKWDLRYSFKASCNMNLKNYPFDTQKCQFLLTFMSSSDAVAKLKWSESSDSPYKEIFPAINIVRDSEPLQFYLRKPTFDFITEDFTTGNYTSLIAIFSLVRRLTGSIVNTYAPSTMIVTMSWVSFWLHVDAVPARVALSVTSLLTLCTQSVQYKSQMPPVNYIKAMDIWLFICIIMVFATLLEFAVSYNLHRQKCRKCTDFDNLEYERKSAKHPTDSPLMRAPKVNPWLNENKKKIKLVLAAAEDSQQNHDNHSKLKICKKCESYCDLGIRIDVMSRKIFPGLFFIFAIIYWIYYLNVS